MSQRSYDLSPEARHAQRMLGVDSTETRPDTPERRPLSPDELLLAQFGQSLLATRAQAVAVIEQCDASLMVLRTLQEREQNRAEMIASLTPAAPSAPRTFGDGKSRGNP